MHLTTMLFCLSKNSKENKHPGVTKDVEIRDQKYCPSFCLLEKKNRTMYV